MNTANRDVWAQRDLLQNEIWTVPTRHCLTLPSRTTYFPPHMSLSPPYVTFPPICHFPPYVTFPPICQ
nr:hypothetical protein Q903MT_gene5173 [Picea sitchensis]